jgi:hypothetical protein
MSTHPCKTANFCTTLEIREESMLANASYEPGVILSNRDWTTGVQRRDRTRFFKAENDDGSNSH